MGDIYNILYWDKGDRPDELSLTFYLPCGSVLWMYYMWAGLTDDLLNVNFKAEVEKPL